MEAKLNVPKGKIKIKYMTAEERNKISKLLFEGLSIVEISERLSRHISKIYRELKRGKTELLDKNNKFIYSPTLAQKRFNESLKHRRRAPKTN